MDEVTPPETPNPEEPFDPSSPFSRDPSGSEPTYLPDLPPERSGCLPKILAILFLFAVIAGIVVVFGGKDITSKLGGFSSFTQKPATLQTWVAETSLSNVKLPAGYSYVGAYKNAFGDKGARLFVVAPGMSELPKDSLAALDVTATDSRFFLVSAEANAMDADFEKASQAIQSQGQTTPLQERIWISGKETPALLRDTAKGGTTYRVLMVPFSSTSFLIVANAKGKFESAPPIALVASLFGVPPADASLVQPEAPGLTLAHAVVSGDTMQRKKSVPMLAALPGPQPEAVAFLGQALLTAAPDVKTDIVAALGLLAKQNSDAVQPLIDTLKDKHARVEAMSALGSLGTQAGAAIPALKAIANNKRESKSVRAAASRALAQVQGRPAPAAPRPKGKPRKRH